MSSLQGRKAAQRGGSHAGKGYITYAEQDRICRRVILLSGFGIGETRLQRKAMREEFQQHLIDQRSR